MPLTKTSSAISILALAILPGMASSASALEDPENGKALSTRWCASCHLVSPEQKSANADVPPFMTIAKKSDEDIAKLEFFLTDPHPRMPNFSLAREAIEDIVAYIRTLR